MKPENPTPVLLTVGQAAAMLAVSERLLWSMTQVGDIPHVRVGRRGVRYLPSDLTTWIESRRTQGRATRHRFEGD